MRRAAPLILCVLTACGTGTVEELTAPGCPTLAVSPASVDFVDLALGASTTAELTLTHACASGPDLSIQVLMPGGGVFSADPAVVSLSPGASSSVTVTVTPTGYGAQASELFLLSNDGVQGTQTVGLSASVDPDQDGDGFEARAVGGEDCDDTQAKANPEGIEAWNGIDDDCDGQVDALAVTAVRHGWVSGGTYRALAHRGNLGFADFNGDGQDSLIIGSTQGYGYGYVLDASNFLDLDDEASRYADAAWSGVASSGALGEIGNRLADNTGDGVPDLVIQGIDRYYPERGNRALVVFDGSALGLELTPDNAVLRLSGGTQYNGGVVSGTDLNGDGIAEIAAGVYLSFDDAYPANRGTVFIHDVSGESGEQSLVGDAESVVEGGDDYDAFGRMPVGADVNGDGYGDLIVGASRESSGATGGGMIYVIPGGLTLPDGSADEVASARIQGETAGGYLGYGSRPLVADVDGDKVDDLVIASVYEDVVYVFSDVSMVDGELDASDADYILEGSNGPDFYGFGLAAGDFDGDGSPELAVGAPDTYTYRSGTIGDAGTVTLYDLTGDSPRQTASIRAEGRQDTFAQTLAAKDLDGDGRDELLVDAPGYLGGGRVYFLTWGE